MEGVEVSEKSPGRWDVKTRFLRLNRSSPGGKWGREMNQMGEVL